jgi:hypothetical protein
MQEKKLRNITIAVMLLGVVLSLIQFLYNRSIWLDEAMLSLNIVNRSYTELLHPLDSMQVAPIGFLLIEKFFSTLMPNSEYGLRIFPLLCFWLSIYFFYQIVTQLLKDVKATLLAVSLFCLNASLIYYSSEVKQYMVDVFISMLLYYFLLKEYKKNTNQYMLLALFGAISIFLSNVSVIILFTISAFLIITQLKNKKINYSYLGALFSTWAVVFSFYYFNFIYNHPSKNTMLAYWGNSFMPINIFKINFWDFCFYKTKMMFGSLLSFGALGLLSFLFFIIGLYQLIKRKQRKLMFFLLLPTLLQLTLSVFKLYPFDLRLILYQTGFYIIIITIGVKQVLELAIFKKQQKLATCVFLLLPLIIGVEFLRNYPLKTEEIKSSINFIKLHVQPNDTIYVYYGAIPAFNYYEKIGEIPFKNPIVFGHAYRGSNQKYIDEIQNNKGKLWILFSHLYDDESKYIITSLNSSHKEVLSYKTEGSEVYLYEPLHK